MFSLSIPSSVREYSNSVYSSASEKAAPIWGHLDSGARMLATEVNNYIESIREGVEFAENSRGEILKKAWEMVRSSSTSEEDSTLQVMKKLAFSLIISLPTTFFIKDIKAKTQLELKNASSVSDAAWMLVRKTIYVGVAVYLMDCLFSMMVHRSAAEHASERSILPV